jgi:hypothetical protein
MEKTASCALHKYIQTCKLLMIYEPTFESFPWKLSMEALVYRPCDLARDRHVEHPTQKELGRVLSACLHLKGETTKDMIMTF